jgi:hypothetical protein
MAKDLKPEEVKKRALETAEIVEDALRNISSQVGNIFKEALDTTSTFSKSLTGDITRGINNLAKSSSTLLSNQEKLRTGALTRAQVEKQIQDRTDKINAITQQINIAKKAGLITGKEANKQLNQALAYENEFINDLNKQADLADQFNKKLGTTGNVIKGLNKIPILGGLIKSEEVLARIQKKTAEEGSTKFGVFKEGVKGVGSSIKDNLLDPVAGFSILTKIVQFFIDAMFAADKRVTDIAKNLSISKDAAAGVYKSIKNSKGELDTAYKTTENLAEAFNDIAQITEFSTLATNDQIETQIVLTKQLGQSKEEALGLQGAFAVSNIEAGKGVDIVYDQIAAFANQNKIIADGRKILHEISKTSKLIQLNFKGNVGELTKSVLEAKKLGLTLDQVSKVGDSLLNFEQSIANELEAELLTGKDINLEKAREFALNNDIAGLTQEIAKQGITAEKFSRMNRIQQEAIAKTLGMSANELADNLYKSELIRKTGGKELEQLKERAKSLRAQKKDTEAINLERRAAAIEQGIVEGKQFKEAQKSVDAQEKFNLALERAKDLFADMVDGGILDKLISFIDKFVGSIESGQSLSSTLLFGPASDKKIAETRKKSISEQLSNTKDKEEKKKLQEKIAEQDAIIARFDEKDKKEAQKPINRAIENRAGAPSQGIVGMRLMAEGGIVNKPTRAIVGEAGPEAVIPLKEFYSKLDELISVVKAGGNVYLDGNKVGTAMNVVSHKTQ